MASTLVPLGDHIIVKPIKETETSSGLVIPDTARDAKSDRGDVLAVGPGRPLDDGTRSVMDVAAGDRVLFAKYAADEITLDGEDLLVITASDVKAKIATA